MKNLFPVLLILFLLSCREEVTTIPPGTIDKETMAEVLVDLHLAQATVGARELSDTSKVSMNMYVESILRMHDIDRDEFFKSMKFYSEHPDILETVYDSVITRLSKMQSEAEGVK